MSSFDVNHKILLRSEEFTGVDRLRSKHQHRPKNSINSINSKEAHNEAINSSINNKSTYQNKRSNSYSSENKMQSFGNHLKINNGPSNCMSAHEQQTQENSLENKTSQTVQNKHQYMDENLKRSEVVLTKRDEEKNSTSIVSQYQNEQDLFDKTNQSEENCNNVATNFEEKKRLRRERMKIRKEMRKQERALLREEEIRKKRLAPKDQKVIIIDHSVLNRFLEKEMSPPIPESTGEYNDSEFPALGEVASPAGISSYKCQKENEYKKGKQIQREDVTSEMEEALKNSQTATVITTPINSIAQNMNTNISSGSLNNISKSKSQEKPTNIENTQSFEGSKQIIKTVEDKKTGKRPKRKDPIHLNINEFIKETKQEIPVKQHSSKPIPKTNVIHYAGNILDSDNPERKRGKQREIPKVKKPSTLKQIILQVREQRREIHLQETLILTKGIDNLEENLSNDNRISNSDDKSKSNENEICITQTQNKSLDRKGDKTIFLSDTNKEMCPEYVHTKNEVPLNVQIEDNSIIVENSDTKNNKNQETIQKQYENNISVVEIPNVDCTKEGSDLVDKLNCQLDGVHQSKKIPNLKIHSRKFREYCDHFLSPDVLNFTTALLEDVVKFHDRQFARSPVKATAKRRHVTGLKEVRKFLSLRRVRLLVIAPDLEIIPGSGGLDDIVAQLKEMAIANEVPYIFALGRRQLGYVLKKKVPVSCVGILNYDGTEHNFHQLMTAVDKAREEYKLRVMNMISSSITPSAEASQAEKITEVKEDVNEEVVASLLSKLSTSQNTENPSPFLQAIERVKCLKEECDDDLQEVNSDQS